MAKEKTKTESKKRSMGLQEEIRKQAEENYITRIEANESGDAFSDWLQAEKEVNKKHVL